MVKPIEEVAKEADRFFMGQSPVHQTLARLAKRLTDMEIPFLVVGCMAVNAHGHQRMTSDVDVLLNKDGLETFKATWLGRGWVEVFKGSKSMRDAVHDIKIDILLSGDYPGDGKPKPIEFPRPETADTITSKAGYPVPSLSLLIELKLASGMTAPHRPRDFDDTIQLIRINQLPQDFAEQLDPYVQAKFLEMWQHAQVEEDY